MNKSEAQKKLNELRLEMLALEKVINEPEIDKTKEMSDFLFAMLKETTAKIVEEKIITFCDKNDEWLIQQDYKNGYLWVRYFLIWKVFEEKYKLNHQEIKEFIQGWMETNTGWKGLTPVVEVLFASLSMETNTGWKGLTPENHLM
jgi:DNA phosphorothioation-dependent restriction protein DptG